ncbi:MAG: 4Fe-4S dicluster domain-containing protein [Thermodesulfobacteriota bacterium]|nr:4Fe-4S dicluster domain-containing protein [Thermodesulfobacteriota bacterium]
MNISRRTFFSCLGAMAGTTLLGGNRALGATNKHFTGYPGCVGVLHDITKCIGCRKCEEACNKVNNLPAPDTPFDDLTVLEEKRRTSVGHYTIVNKYETKKRPLFVKTQCNHCLEPACASACFVKALRKDKSGAVLYDESLCVGCRYCMVACPFNVPAYEYNDALTPAVTKCTLCFTTRLQEGELPGCVAACPKEALVFGEREKLIDAAWKTLYKHPDRYVSHVYGEHEMGGTSWLYLSPVPFSEVGFREDLGVEPAPQLTAGPLSAVPIVVGLWPVFLTGIYAISRRRDKLAEAEKQAAVEETTAALNAEMARKLDEQKEKMIREKESAIEFEVKKALEDVEQERQADASSGETPDESTGKSTDESSRAPSGKDDTEES